VIARSVQGIGAALLVPGSLAIISASFDEDRAPCHRTLVCFYGDNHGTGPSSEEEKQAVRFNHPLNINHACMEGRLKFRCSDVGYRPVVKAILDPRMVAAKIHGPTLRRTDRRSFQSGQTSHRMVLSLNCPPASPDDSMPSRSECSSAEFYV